MTLDEIISVLDYLVNKCRPATLELGEEDEKQLIQWLKDYQKVRSTIDEVALAYRRLIEWQNF